MLLTIFNRYFFRKCVCILRRFKFWTISLKLLDISSGEFKKLVIEELYRPRTWCIAIIEENAKCNILLNKSYLSSQYFQTILILLRNLRKQHGHGCRKFVDKLSIEVSRWQKAWGPQSGSGHNGDWCIIKPDEFSVRIAISSTFSTQAGQGYFGMG